MQDVLKWSEFDLHLLVACFLRVRFPIVVALNKAMIAVDCTRMNETCGTGSSLLQADTPEAAHHISRVQATRAHVCRDACSAFQGGLGLSLPLCRGGLGRHLLASLRSERVMAVAAEAQRPNLETG